MIHTHILNLSAVSNNFERVDNSSFLRQWSRGRRILIAPTKKLQRCYIQNLGEKMKLLETSVYFYCSKFVVGKQQLRDGR